jgi:hypothetical protein
MDGYEYEAKVLWPKWNNEIKSKEASTAGISKDTKDRLKNEFGIEIKKDPAEVELGLANKMLGNPSNFYPELSPDYEYWKSTKRSKWV